MKKQIYWRETAIERLSSMKRDESAAESLPYQLRQLKLLCVEQGLSEEDERRNRAVLARVLKRRLNDARQRCRENTRAMDTLTDMDRELLRLRWISPEPVMGEALAERMNIRPCDLYRLEYAALRRFADALYGIEEAV